MTRLLSISVGICDFPDRWGQSGSNMIKCGQTGSNVVNQNQMSHDLKFQQSQRPIVPKSRGTRGDPMRS